MENAPIPTLDDLMLVNDELVALDAARVPLALGAAMPGESAATAYARFTAILGRRISQGSSLEDALRAEEPGIPARYRALMLLGIPLEQIKLALDTSRSLATAQDESRFIFRAGLIYPALVGVVALVGAFSFFRWFLPRLLSLYEPPGLEPGYWVSWLVTIRNSAPVWLPALLLALVAAGFAWRRFARAQTARRLSDPLHLAARTRHAQFAEICAQLLERGVDREEAVRLAADATEGTAPSAPRSAYGARLAELPPERAMPPLLAFALSQATNPPDGAQALRAAAKMYRQSTIQREERLHLLVPLLLTIFVGGAIALAYGLLMFLPMAELLEALSQY